MVVGEKPLREAKQQLASGFDQNAVSLPGTQNAAGGKWSDVRGIGQLFICQINACPTRNLMAETVGKSYQDLSEPFFRAMRNQARVCSEIPC
jgi:hypothetical protein